MQSIAQIMWGPWLVYGVPAAGLLVWILTRGGGSKVTNRTQPDRERLYRNRLVASAAGMGGLGGVGLAIELGGPGAVAWLWATLLLGAGLNVGQARVGATTPPHTVPRPVAMIVGLLTLVAALTAGALFQSQQMGALWQQASGMADWSAAFLVAAAAAPALLFAGARHRLFSAAPTIVGLYLVGCLLILLQDTHGVVWALGHIANHALDYQPAGGGIAGAGLTMAMIHGATRAVMVGELGLGVSARARPEGLDPGRASRIAGMVSLGVGGLVATATALVVLIGPESQEPVAERVVVPLELHQSRGLRPSADVGQTIVLPENTTLEAGQTYPMVLRANPRGNTFWQARLEPEANAIVIPRFEVLEQVDTVVLRPANKILAANPGWDVRIPVRQEVFEPQPGYTFIRLTPEDPETQFRKLIVRRVLDKTVYLVAKDFRFEGRVATAMSPDPSLGEHLAMFEQRAEDAPLNPKLHEFFRAGYRGPYFDDGSERPPFAAIGVPGLELARGDVVEMELRSPPRGAGLLRLDKLGVAVAPAWRFLERANKVVIRHEEDPSRDVYVPVEATYDEGRLRFSATEEAFADFRVVSKMEGFEGPFLVTPPYRFAVEARRDTRLADEWRGRMALVPLHPQSEPTGPPPQGLYSPHPGEVLASDLLGPFPAEGQGAAVVAARFAERLGPIGRAWIVLTALALCAGTIAAWATWAGQSGSSLGVSALAMGAIFVGAGMQTADALVMADTALGALALVGILGLVARVGSLRS